MQNQCDSDLELIVTTENRRAVLSRGRTGGAVFAAAAETSSTDSPVAASQEGSTAQAGGSAAEDRELETIISKKKDNIVLINVFTVLPDNQQKLADILVKMHQEVIADVPGFISANVHMSLDGERVIVYAQYTDLSAVTAMQKSNVTEIFREALALGEVQFNRLRLYEIIHASS